MDYRFENEDEIFASQQSWHQPQSQPQPPKKSHTGRKVAALVLSCALVGGAMGYGASALYARQNQGENEPEQSAPASVVYEGSRGNSVIDIAKIDTSSQMTPAEVYAQNVNSTVGIRTSITTNYWGYQTQSAASGSGFILTADGYILTNYHVVENSDSITVSLYDGTSYDATLVGCDDSNDIAVLKVEAENLMPVVLGDSENLNVGDQVVAIGNPLGELTFSLTTGVVSALDREITLSSNVTMELIQTDCAINSGNSGGALFNLYGEVIGITNAKYSSSGSSSEASIDNIGFAIPMNHVKSIVKSIIETGSITKPYIGVSVTNVSSEAQNYGLPAGAAVYSVVEGSPAEEAGLVANDIITEVNGTEITSSSELVDYVGEREVGEELRLRIYRQGEQMELTLTVGETTKSALPEQTQSTQQSQQNQQSQQGPQGSFPFFGY